jgi:hypothetical protein
VDAAFKDYCGSADHEKLMTVVGNTSNVKEFGTANVQSGHRTQTTALADEIAISDSPYAEWHQ